MKKFAENLWAENKSFIVFLLLMFVFRSAVADWNDVPTGSMKPTIMEGDRILINKMAYDIRVPFTHLSLVKMADPKRGDIVVFDSKVSNIRLVKRVIGLPGDRVEMKQNVLTINGETLEYAQLKVAEGVIFKAEKLPGKTHRVRLSHNAPPASNFPATVVPQGQYLVLGDNRDNSADSRVIGFVPRGEIVGRTERVAISLDYDNYYMPRADRFFEPLR